MKTTAFIMLTLLASLLACTEEESFNKSLPLQIDAHAMHHHQNYSSHLNGAQERPNPIDSKGQGQVHLKLNKEGTSLHYKLNVANIENVTQAHLHLISNEMTQTGGIVVWLYPSAPPSQLIEGRFNGTLGEGEITDANLVGALVGMTLQDLINAINEGKIYANVHTLQFPPGEIRGDL